MASFPFVLVASSLVDLVVSFQVEFHLVEVVLSLVEDHPLVGPYPCQEEAPYP